MMFKIKRIGDFRPVPYWHRLLLYFQNKGYIANGLTIPFLLGARKIIDPEAPMLSIDELINELMEYGATIMKCGYINEFVIGCLDSETEQMAGYVMKFKNLVISDDSFGNQNSLEEIVVSLKEIYGSVLSENKYSKVEGMWMDFSETDLKRLRELS